MYSMALRERERDVHTYIHPLEALDAFVIAKIVNTFHACIMKDIASFNYVVIFHSIFSICHGLPLFYLHHKKLRK